MGYAKELLPIRSLPFLEFDRVVREVDGRVPKLKQILLQLRGQFLPATAINFQVDLSFHLDLPLIDSDFRFTAL